MAEARVTVPMVARDVKEKAVNMGHTGVKFKGK